MSTSDASPPQRGPLSKFWIAVPLLAVSGAAQGLISPPASWLPLHFVAWIVPLALFSRLGSWKAFFAGWLVGFAAVTSCFYWLVYTMVHRSSFAVPAAIVVLLIFAAAFGLYTAVFAAGVRRLRRFETWWPLAVPMWFTACEFLNPQLFPYYQGVAWYEMPWIFLVVTVTGVPGMTFIVLNWNCVLLQFWERWRSRGEHDEAWWEDTRLHKNFAVTFALLVFAAGVSATQIHRVSKQDGKTRHLRVALIQPDVGFEEQNVGAFAIEAAAQLSLEAAREHEKIDAFVWPEATLPGAAGDRVVYSYIATVIQRTGAEVWTGAGYVDQDSGKARNAGFRIDDQGKIHERYDKLVPLPFGEYVPDWVRRWLPFVEVPIGTLEPGTDQHVYFCNGRAFVFLICYEAIISDCVRSAVKKDVDVLTTITFDDWYGDTSCREQFVMLCAIQCALNGVPMIRSAATGISAVIDARGRITHRTEIDVREALVADVQLAKATTVYTQVGDLFAWLCVAASALWIAGGILRRIAPRRTSRTG